MIPHTLGADGIAMLDPLQQRLLDHPSDLARQTARRNSVLERSTAERTDLLLFVSTHSVTAAVMARFLQLRPVGGTSKGLEWLGQKLLVRNSR